MEYVRNTYGIRGVFYSVLGIWIIQDFLYYGIFYGKLCVFHRYLICEICFVFYKYSIATKNAKYSLMKYVW
ncbi:hypothetical protein BD770DRAFT_403880 [Pilaira anomala]|nr:hypothetical protein BD770DRAFT_403880 [Pilaira anomala]